MLENVGFKDQKMKATVNGCLQVGSHCLPPSTDLYRHDFQIWNLVAASTGALLVDRVGRRTLFIVSNAGMLMGQCLSRIGYDGVVTVTLPRAAFSVLALSSSLFYSGMMAGGHGPLRLSLLIASAPNAFFILQ